MAGLKMCVAETPPFSRDPVFADPAILLASGCHVASAEGRFRFWRRQVMIKQEIKRRGKRNEER